MSSVVAPCIAYYGLLAAIFAKDRDEVLARKGLLRYEPKRLCRSCGQEIAEGKVYCAACWLIPVACDNCGRVIERQRDHVLRGYPHQFCTRACHGQWVHQHGLPKQRKYDWEKVWSTHLATGYGAARLSSLLGIPRDTTFKILRTIKERQAAPEIGIQGG